MTKRDLVVRIGNENGWKKTDVLKIVQLTFDLISEALADGKKVELRGFGVFKVVLRKARIGRNPKEAATDFRIPPRAVVKFKAGKKMGSSGLALTPEQER